MQKKKVKKSKKKPSYKAVHKQVFGLNKKQTQYPSGAKFLAPGSKPLPSSYFKNLR